VDVNVTCICHDAAILLLCHRTLHCCCCLVSPGWAVLLEAKCCDQRCGFCLHSCKLQQHRIGRVMWAYPPAPTSECLAAADRLADSVLHHNKSLALVPQCMLTNDEHHSLDRLLPSISICVHDDGGACTATVCRIRLLLWSEDVSEVAQAPGLYNQLQQDAVPGCAVKVAGWCAAKHAASLYVAHVNWMQTYSIFSRIAWP
jgi:hypothetical protein